MLATDLALKTPEQQSNYPWFHCMIMLEELIALKFQEGVG